MPNKKSNLNSDTTSTGLMDTQVNHLTLVKYASSPMKDVKSKKLLIKVWKDQNELSLRNFIEG